MVPIAIVPFVFIVMNEKHAQINDQVSSMMCHETKKSTNVHIVLPEERVWSWATTLFVLLGNICSFSTIKHMQINNTKELLSTNSFFFCKFTTTTRVFLFYNGCVPISLYLANAQHTIHAAVESIQHHSFHCPFFCEKNDMPQTEERTDCDDSTLLSLFVTPS